MPNIISNTSCLIALDNIGMIYILKNLYDKIIISKEVSHEFGKPVEDWIIIKQVKNRNYLKILNALVDLGEASTIALALEITDALTILDDSKARKLAKNLGVKYTGLLGILLKAKEKNVISSVKDVLLKLKSANFFINDAIEKEVLRLANE
jgi:predicted nucleic acid-binding protein